MREITRDRAGRLPPGRHPQADQAHADPALLPAQLRDAVQGLGQYGEGVCGQGEGGGVRGKHFCYWESDDLRATVERAIYYFNNERPVRKLNGKPPVLFRTERVA